MFKVRGISDAQQMSFNCAQWKHSVCEGRGMNGGNSLAKQMNPESKVKNLAPFTLVQMPLIFSAHWIEVEDVCT